MKIIRDDENTRRILAQKLDEACVCDPHTDQLIAEAEANYARQQSLRRRKRLGSIAAIFIAVLLISSGYILGMKTDSRASADNDNEVRIVQQGDNIIIGQGVSEKDENVGVVTKTYYDIEDVPEEVREEISIVDLNSLSVKRIRVKETKNGLFFETLYTYNDVEMVMIRQQELTQEITPFVVLPNKEDKWEYSGITIYREISSGEMAYSLFVEEWLFDIIVSNSIIEIKIEDIIDDLVS